MQTIHFEQLDELDDVVEYLVAKCPEGLDVAIDCTSHDPKVGLAQFAVYLALILFHSPSFPTPPRLSSWRPTPQTSLTNVSSPFARWESEFVSKRIELD